MKVFTSLKICAAILVAVIDLSRLRSAHADDPAYYKLTEVEDLTFYKQGDNELRPTFSFETVGFGQVNTGWGKSSSPFGNLGKNWFEIAVTPGIQGSLGLGGYGKTLRAPQWSLHFYRGWFGWSRSLIPLPILGRAHFSWRMPTSVGLPATFFPSWTRTASRSRRGAKIPSRGQRLSRVGRQLQRRQARRLLVGSAPGLREYRRPAATQRWSPRRLFLSHAER